MDIEEADAGLHASLGEWAERLERLEWSALITDARWNLKWVSSSLRAFLRVDHDVDLGFGLTLIEAWSSRQEWLRTSTPESQVQLFFEVAPFLVRALQDDGLEVQGLLAEPFATLVEQVTPAPQVPLLWSSSFEYLDPSDTDLPPYRVNFCGIRMNDDDGSPIGNILIFFMDVNPNLMQLLVRGDQQMYERMARLVEPQAQQAVVLFCDLHESGRVSRQLSSAAYFKLVRQLWTRIDAAIANEGGIVGKHAGDGASAFFLAEDAGSASAAAAAAIRAARIIQGTAQEVFNEVLAGECLMKVGLHWGGALYMGQLVPGGRLEVTALGDEVNEAARVQESATPGATLVTKQLLERLDPEDAAALGIDLEKIRYNVLSDLDSANEKARRDAGALAVSSID